METCYLKDNWEKYIIKDEYEASWFFEAYKADASPSEFRVPYLTKEQIEAEGWRFESAHFVKDIDKNSYYSLTMNEGNNIVITKSYIEGWAWIWGPFYSGECKDINTLRYLLKLLNI